jgi:predicted transposase/invertase (TIGR01784 family)
MYGSQLDYINLFSTANEQISELEKLAELEKQGKLGYSGLKKCIVISLIDFNFFDDPEYHRFYTLKDGKTNEQHQDLDYLDLYFIELKKYQGKLQHVKTTLERWITFLNNAHRYDNKSLPKELAEIKEIRKASQQLDVMYLDEQEKRYYESQQKFWLDQNSFIKDAVEKAVEQAEMNSKIEVAKAMLASNEPLERIAKYTGLSLELVARLADNPSGRS